MNKKTMLIFDFFGVISSEIAPFWLSKHFNKEQAKEIKGEIVGLADIGMISEEEMFKELSKITKVPADAILQEWLDLAVIDTQIVEFIKEAKKDYVIVLLSNAPAKFLQHILDKNNLKPLFEKIVISSEVRTAKPNKHIYQLMLNEMKGKYNKAIMIDDNHLNLIGAKEVDIKGILYKDFSSFRSELSVILTE